MAIKGARKKSHQKSVDLVFFDKLFRGMWAQMMVQMSIGAAQNIFHRALKETMLHYPILEHARIREGGVNLKELEQHRNDIQKHSITELERALWAYVENVAHLSEELSGPPMSEQIIHYVTSQAQGRAFANLLHRTGLKF